MRDNQLRNTPFMKTITPHPGFRKNPTPSWKLASLAGLVFTLSGVAARADLASPLEIPGHVLWLDGADFDGDGSPDAGVTGTPLASWTDKSAGQGTNSVIATGGAPTMRFGANSAAHFIGGSEDKLDSSTLNVGGDYTVFTISRAEAFAASGHILSGLNGTGTDAVLYKSGANDYNFYSGQSTGNVNQSFGNQPTSSQFNFIGYQISSTGTDSTFLQSTRKSFEFGGPATLNGIRIGNLDRATPSSTVNAEAFHGEIAEVLVYDRVLSGAEINDIGRYLKAKYNLSAAFSTGAAVEIETGHVSGGVPSTLNPATAAMAGGRVNAALAGNGGLAFSQDHIGGSPRDFRALRVNDGLYADPAEGAPPVEEPWIGNTLNSSVGIRLATPSTIDHIAFETEFPDRRNGAAILEFTTDDFSGVSLHSEEGLDPAAVAALQWNVIDVFQLADTENTRHLYNFAAIPGVTGVRLRLESNTGAQFAISEMEVWAVPEPAAAALALSAAMLLTLRQRRRA